MPYIDWTTVVAIVIVLGLAVVGIAKLGEVPPLAEVRDIEPTPEGEDEGRLDALLAAGERVQAWRGQVVTAREPEPVAHHALGLFGRMRVALARVLTAPTKDVPVVGSAPDEPEEEQAPAPFDPLTSPIEIPEPEAPLDTWALLGYERPSWDVSFTSQWEALTPERLAQMDAARLVREAVAA